MSAVPIVALTIGAVLLALGLRSSSRKPQSDDGNDGLAWWSEGGSDGADCGGDGGGCD